MLHAWRIVDESFLANAFDGEGAYRMGGRWNSKERRVVYTSSSLSLAALETLAHLNPSPAPFKFLSIRIEIDESLVEVLTGRLPRGWNHEPPRPPSKSIGDAWLTAGRTAILAVPSIIVPSELNYLVNPLHPDFRKIVIGKPKPFKFDGRLLS